MAMHSSKTRLQNSQNGASLVEYCLLISLVAFVCMASITYVGKEIESKFNFFGAALRESEINGFDGGGTEIGGGPNDKSGGGK